MQEFVVKGDFSRLEGPLELFVQTLTAPYYTQDSHAFENYPRFLKREADVTFTPERLLQRALANRFWTLTDFSGGVSSIELSSNFSVSDAGSRLRQAQRLQKRIIFGYNAWVEQNGQLTSVPRLISGLVREITLDGYLVMEGDGHPKRYLLSDVSWVSFDVSAEFTPLVARFWFTRISAKKASVTMSVFSSHEAAGLQFQKRPRQSLSPSERSVSLDSPAKNSSSSLENALRLLGEFVSLRADKRFEYFQLASVGLHEDKRHMLTLRDSTGRELLMNAKLDELKPLRKDAQIPSNFA